MNGFEVGAEVVCVESGLFFISQGSIHKVGVEYSSAIEMCDNVGLYSKEYFIPISQLPEEASFTREEWEHKARLDEMAKKDEEIKEYHAIIEENLANAEKGESMHDTVRDFVNELLLGVATNGHTTTGKDIIDYYEKWEKKQKKNPICRQYKLLKQFTRYEGNKIKTWEVGTLLDLIVEGSHPMLRTPDGEILTNNMQSIEGNPDFFEPVKWEPKEGEIVYIPSFSLHDKEWIAIAITYDKKYETRKHFRTAELCQIVCDQYNKIDADCERG